MFPLDPASLRVLINVRPDALAQVLHREGVVALAVEYRDECSLDSTGTSTHKRTIPSSFPVCKSLKRRHACWVEHGAGKQSDGIFQTASSPILLTRLVAN